MISTTRVSNQFFGGIGESLLLLLLLLLLVLLEEVALVLLRFGC